jgi:hypothetical protein
MSMPCPTPEELTGLLDGELTENRAARLRGHAAGCTACAAELEAQRRLVARLRAPVPGVPSPGALAAVMGRLDRAGAPAAAPPARRRVAWVAGLSAAAAALLALAGTLPARERDAFAPRGAEVAWTSKVGVELWALEGRPRRLQEGDLLPAGVALVASYSNVDPAPAWLLAFAVDGRGEVHWLYPAWLDPATDPPATRLEGSAVQRALPESVVLEGVPEGALRLVTVVSPRSHRVSEIEDAGPAGLEPGALQRRWPDARVEALSVRHAAPAPRP